MFLSLQSSIFGVAEDRTSFDVSSADLELVLKSRQLSPLVTAGSLSAGLELVLTPHGELVLTPHGGSDSAWRAAGHSSAGDEVGRLGPGKDDCLCCSRTESSQVSQGAAGSCREPVSW